jgi:predicted  nucleic acid-binding Zn-ribbon protein
MLYDNPSKDELFERDLYNIESAMAYLQKYVEESTTRSESRQKMLKNISANLKALREDFEDEMMDKHNKR